MNFVIESEYLTSQGWDVQPALFLCGHRATAQVVAEDQPRWFSTIRPLGENRRADLAQEFKALAVLELPDLWLGARFEHLAN